ncbi:MAG: ABC transporter permease [Pirellulaceae bacterium]
MTSAPPGAEPPRYSPLRELIVARVKEFVRQPEAIFWSYAFPVLMVLALGVAFRNKPVTRIVLDTVPGPGAQRIQERLADDAGFEVHVVSESEALLRLRTARTDLIVLTNGRTDAAGRTGGTAGEPAGADDASRESTGTVESYRYLYDPTRPESALARLRVDDALQRAAGRKDWIAVSDQLVEEPGSRYVDFLVPGLLGMNIMAGGLWGVGFAIVYMRIRKLLKRLVATPMKRSHFLAGVIISRLLFMIPGVLVILLFAWLVFGVAVQGSVLQVVALILLGAFTFSGIGLLVASRADTIETVSGLMNLVMLPMWVFSGVFFSSERFPDFLQPVIQALPLTPLIDGLRATMLEGVPLTSPAQLVRIAWLVGWGLLTSGLALRWFRWT